MLIAVQATPFAVGDHADAQQVLEALRAMPLLKDLEPGTLGRLAAITRIVRAVEGTILCQEGEQAGELHIVLDGQIAVLAQAANGTSAVVEVLDAGATIGLSAVLASLPRLMTARVVRPARLLSIDAQALRALVAAGTAAGDGCCCGPRPRISAHWYSRSATSSCARRHSALRSICFPCRRKNMATRRRCGCPSTSACSPQGWAAGRRTCRERSRLCAAWALKRTARG